MKASSNRSNLISHIILVVSLTIVGMLNSCKEPEPYSIIPQIYFENLNYYEYEENGPLDSLVLYFRFEDGDGDLGVGPSESCPPYHDFDLIVDTNGHMITISQDTIDFPMYVTTPGSASCGSSGFSDFYSETDIRTDFNCIEYDTLYINEEKDVFVSPGTSVGDIDLEIFHKDTVYLQRNEFRYNMVVDFYRKRGIDNYELIDWLYETSDLGCGLSFYGRFPILDHDNIGSSLEGVIKYSMLSSGFRVVLAKDTFKLEFKIYDRATNESNVASTGDVTLDQLIR